MITIRHTIGDLADDIREIPIKAVSQGARIVRENAWQGRDLAQASARATARSHGKHYHKAITAEMRTPLEWEFGPESGKRQGGMSFEHGSRNQPPHKDIERAADVVAGEFHRDVHAMVGRLFW